MLSWWRPLRWAESKDSALRESAAAWHPAWRTSPSIMWSWGREFLAWYLSASPPQPLRFHRRNVLLCIPDPRDRREHRPSENSAGTEALSCAGHNTLPRESGAQGGSGGGGRCLGREHPHAERGGLHVGRRPEHVPARGRDARLPRGDRAAVEACLVGPQAAALRLLQRGDVLAALRRRAAQGPGEAVLPARAPARRGRRAAPDCRERQGRDYRCFL